MLELGYEVYLVSSGSVGSLCDKARWSAEHLPFMKDRLFLTDRKTPKGLIRGDVLIDDGPHNLLDYKARNPNGCAIAADYLYTAPAHSVCDYVVPFQDSAKGWSVIVDLLGKKSL